MATNLNDKLHNVLGEICMAESDAKERDEYTLAETLAKAGDHVIEAIRLIETLAREAEALRWDAIERLDAPKAYKCNGVFTP